MHELPTALNWGSRCWIAKGWGLTQTIITSAVSRQRESGAIKHTRAGSPVPPSQQAMSVGTYCLSPASWLGPGAVEGCDGDLGTA